jgi:hypothetical protein
MPLFRNALAGGLVLAIAAGVGLGRAVDPAPAAHAQTPGRVFELRTYTAAPGKFDALNARFRNHTVRLFAKHGVSNIAYWTPVEGPMAGNTLIYVIPHASRAAATTFWNAFLADPEWVKAKAASEVNGPLTSKVDAVFMTATDYSHER